MHRLSGVFNRVAGWLILITGPSFVSAANTASAEALVSVTAEGWTVTADPQRASFSVSHEGMGTLLSDATLNVRDAHGTHRLSGWTADREGKNQLTLRSVQPRLGWVIELRQDLLKISSTSHATVVHAGVPAPEALVPARLLDPEGAPVDWVGNNEVEGLYGGVEAHTPSFLPKANADVMYFALGRVESPAFHALFDRQRDIAIDFPEGSILARDADDATHLDLTLSVDGNAVIRLKPEYFTRTLHVPYYVPFDDSYFKTAPMVWSSWTSYYEAVREEDMVKNTDWLAANLKDYGFDYVQLDDGYDRGPMGEHSWIENWDKQRFPHGPEWLAAYIKSKGLHPGIWLVPNSYASATTTHPDWYLRDRAGHFVEDYSTPALDSTNPAVMEHLRRLFGVLRGWGFDYFKFDGEHSVPKYAPMVDRARMYDVRVDPLVNYRDRLKVIRDAIGPHAFIEGCPAGTPLNGIGYFNSYFTGEDLYANWQGMYPLFSSITASAFLNHMVVYVMPGEGMELGPPQTVEEAARTRAAVVLETAREREAPLTGLGTTQAEARTLVSYVALSGVVYSLASVMPELPKERVALVKATLPTLPILPVDLFSRGTDAVWDKFKHVQADYYVHNYPDTLDLKVNGAAGVYDVVGLTNWRSSPETRQLDLRGKLGLAGNRPYVVFDFWRQKEIGTRKGILEVPIEPHDTRVLFIHPLLDRPQLVGMSRHISGSYSLRGVEWDTTRRVLHGISDTVAGDSYTLWFHVPRGYGAAHVNAKAGLKGVAVEQQVMGESLRVRFAAQAAPVEWEIGFGSGAASGQRKP